MAKHWTIQEVARLAGTTSRTLRHYDAIGILRPSAIAAHGYRLYNASALVRLQRILAMRDLGMGLREIGAVLDQNVSETEALTTLQRRLALESTRLQRQIASVQRTLESLQNGGDLMANEMFDGFGHEQFKDEVEERWGKDAWQNSNEWWNRLGSEGQQDHQRKMADLISRWKQLHEDDVSPESDLAQAVAHEHVDWLKETPGPHTTGECTLPAYIQNLGEMYVNDPRFAANYGGEAGATLVRDALRIYVTRRLS